MTDEQTELAINKLLEQDYDELRKLYRAGGYVEKDTVKCKVEGLGSFTCFSRNLKPRIKLVWYSKSKRFYWRVERDMSIKWKHLTMQEKSNLDAAYEFVNERNYKMVE